MYLFRPLLLFGILSTCAFAQETIHLATVGGRVTDPSGAIVQAAKVTVRHVDTNTTASTQTDAEGRFRFPYLKIGLSEVRARHQGFADSVRTLTLTVGGAYDVPMPLSVESKETNVIVDSNTTAIETARSQIAGTVPQTEVRSLPLNGRNFLDIALLVPGVSPTNTASNQLFAETSAVPGQGISVGSQRNFSNNYIVDGLSANDDAAGLSGIFYGLDVVNEFQVVTSGGQAEFGRALGGYMNMVTKSGTNVMHGDLYGYFRNQRFNAANRLSNAKLPLTQMQYGTSLSGPIKLDRTFYFANFEQRALNQSGLITIAPLNVAAINTRLAAVGYKGDLLSNGLYPNPVHNTNFLGKIDHQFSNNDQFTARYSLYDVHSKNSRGAGALNGVTAAAGLDNTDQTLAVSNVWTVSSRTMNETRGQFTYSSLDASPNDQSGPAVSIAGVAGFGRLSGSPTARDNKLYEIADTVSHQAGAHALRAGIDFLYNDLAITFPRAVKGSYAFSSLANFLTGIYNTSGYTQTFGNTMVPQRNPNIGFYAQDEWRVAHNLTLNLGFRYDLQYLETVHTDRNNFSPRAGFAYTPFNNRRTVIRGSYGLFYDRVPLRAVANALLSSGNGTALTSTSQVSVSLSPAQTGAPVFPNVLTSLPPGVLLNFTTMDRNIQNAYSTQGSVEVEHQLTNTSTLSVGYQHLRGLHLILSINQNAPACAAVGTNNGCRPNAAYSNNNQYSSLGDSRYDALHVSFIQRPVKWGSYRISYAYSKSLDNLGEFFFSGPIDNHNVWQDYGRSDDDQRHRLVFNGSARLIYGVQLGSMLQYYSPLPLNITTGATTIQGTAARPTVNGAFIERNAGIGNDLFTIGARLSRAFTLTDRVKMEAIAEAFNALNHRNNLIRNGAFGAGAYPSSPAATFGQITAVNDARSLQFALRFRF